MDIATKDKAYKASLFLLLAILFSISIASLVISVQNKNDISSTSSASLKKNTSAKNKKKKHLD